MSSSKRDLKESVLDAYCPYFLYLSIGMHASNFFFRIVGIPMCLSFHILSLLPGLGRILEFFYIMLRLVSMGLTMRIG
jgi:hypothetical protein